MQEIDRSRLCSYCKFRELKLECRIDGNLQITVFETSYRARVEVKKKHYTSSQWFDPFYFPFCTCHQYFGQLKTPKDVKIRLHFLKDPNRKKA